MSDSSVKDYPVVYFGMDHYTTARDTKGSPYVVIANQVGSAHAVNSALNKFTAPLQKRIAAVNALAQSTWPDPTRNMGLGQPNWFAPLQSRLRCVVVNALHDCPIIAESVYVNHSYQSGQPVVTDENGARQRVPSEFRSVGDISYDWIDAPPKHFASVGAWAANRPEISFYGTDIGLTLSMPVHKTFLKLSLIQSINKESNKFRGDLYDDHAGLTDDDDYYDKCDDHALADSKNSSSFTFTNKSVKVTLRTDQTYNGVDLYAFVEGV